MNIGRRLASLLGLEGSGGSDGPRFECNRCGEQYDRLTTPCERCGGSVMTEIE